MREFIDLQLILLIKESTKRSVSTGEWEQAYDEFASRVLAAKVVSEKMTYHNALCYVKAELGFWQEKSGSPEKKRQT
jgi:hypothetical protein